MESEKVEENPPEEQAQPEPTTNSNELTEEKKEACKSLYIIIFHLISKTKNFRNF